MRGKDGGVSPVGRLIVHVGTRGDQHLGRFEITVARGEQDRGVSAVLNIGLVVGVHVLIRRGLPELRPNVGADIDVGFVRQQYLNRFGVVLCDGPHERGLALQPFDGVDVGAPREQQLHGVEAAGARRGHERRLAFAHGPRHVRAPVEQRADRGRVAGASGLQQRRRGLRVGDPQRPLATAVAIGAAARVAFHPAEVRQDVVVAPAARVSNVALTVVTPPEVVAS